MGMLRPAGKCLSILVIVIVLDNNADKKIRLGTRYEHQGKPPPDRHACPHGGQWRSRFRWLAALERLAPLACRLHAQTAGLSGRRPRAGFGSDLCATFARTDPRLLF